MRYSSATHTVKTIGNIAFLALVIPLVYTLLMSLPILNNIISVITFEALMPGSWFLRSIILAFYIAFVPKALVLLISWLQRRRVYEKKLQEHYGKETVKVLGRS
jgi:pilus assembly protein TadC